MHYLRDIEEQLDEYRRATAAAHYEQRDIDILDEIQQTDSRSLRKSLATAFVQFGIKLDPRAASLAGTREAA